jgi:hypothetical protein
MDKIEKVEDHFGSPPLGSRSDKPAEWALALRKENKRGEMPLGVSKDYTVDAKINHGRWIAECPVCHSAQVTSPDDKRFFCIQCENVSASGKWATVKWPSAPQVGMIEELLLVRPDVKTRNWIAGESVADLRKENEDNLPKPVKTSRKVKK